MRQVGQLPRIIGVNVLPEIVYADFEPAIHNAVTTVCGQTVQLKHVFDILDRAGSGKCNLWDSASSMETTTLR